MAAFTEKGEAAIIAVLERIAAAIERSVAAATLTPPPLGRDEPPPIVQD